MQLYNKINGKVLKDKMQSANEERITLSFYKYYQLNNPGIFRDHLFIGFRKLNVMGRVYVAREGINAQVSIDKNQYSAFVDFMNAITFLKGIRLNAAVEDNGKSFFKLKIKVRDKILADGLNDATFNVTETGKHLKAAEFNELADRDDSVIIDMRNHYESEVGHFENAILPDADTFRDALSIAAEALENQKDKHIIMYCTGGIRCEKASAYFKHIGFDKVYQLAGGIIKYAHDADKSGLENKYVGKNFVFDERLGERISSDIIASCHQCGKPCDTHTNCKNVACNLLFIQCEECAEKYAGCCSAECHDITKLPEEAQKELRKGKDPGVRIFSKGRNTKKINVADFDSCST